jgi:peptide/nickel transport system substrate-binding protein
MMRSLPLAAALACLAALITPAAAIELKESPMLAVAVAAGKLPPVEKRAPAEPLVVRMDGPGQAAGKPGGDLRTMIGRSRDVRLMVVYGYARLVGYDSKFAIRPDLLKAIEVEDNRVFTMRLRKGHKWSNGDPFTAEDFRYYWEDIANNPELSPSGPPITLLVNGERPKVEILDEVTVRYSWSRPNPFFLPRLAGTAPLFIFRPATYLKRFHKKYADAAAIGKAVEEANARNWAELHNKLDNLYEFDNPDLPTLQPWMITTRPPAIRFVAERNPYFHRVDPAGVQLPYIDRVVMSFADGKLIPAKAGSGEADLQARNINFSNFTFLKENEQRAGYRTLLWKTAKGSHFALFPNLNCSDPVWRQLMRDVRFRRALSLAIDREGINQSLYFGLAIEGGNTVLPDSPLFKEEYQKAWAAFDLKKAGKLLDELGLAKRDKNGVRLLPDGRPLEVIVETAGEDTEQTDVLQLIGETWAKVGIKLFSKPSQREVVRNRIFSGEALMSVWSGLENGVPTADESPGELAPTFQHQLQWPKWGQHYETRGQAGEKIDMPVPQELFDLYNQWIVAKSGEERTRIWQRMLQLNADNVFSVGVIAAVPQPVVATKALRNIPEEGIYNWEPGAFFGIYRPETFWLDR